MSTTYNGRIHLEIALNEIIASALKNGTVGSVFRVGPTDLPAGTSDGQINVGFYKRETGIGSAVTTVYDLVGSLTNTEGTTINFDEVTLIGIRNLNTTAANYILIGPDATAGFGALASNKGFWADASDRNVIMADGNSWTIFHSYTGVPAVAATTDELAVITSATTGNTWDIIILGRDN